MASKRCYYDVLNIPRDADDEDLKKSYRKLALKWHPDKNLENVDAAKREFILIQQAYEVLSDPQERAFYDRHRESILRGADSGYKDESLELFEYFTSSCYCGFDDDENSFYTVYREVFNKLAAEESEYMTDSDPTPPEFGNSLSSYDDVKSFYDYWQSFCTKKSYSWQDKWDLTTAENRQVSRLMMQDNKKMRDKAKKERNELIRELVAFVRKRDKRVQAYSEYLKKKTEENSRKTEEHRRKMIAKHRKDIESCKEAEWSKFSNFENELKEIENEIATEFNDHDDSNESDIDELFCVACNKSFKTEKAFANHEKSKKHKENVLLLKDSMIAEENSLNNLDTDAASEGITANNSFCAICNQNFKTEKAFANHQKSKKHIENEAFCVDPNARELFSEDPETDSVQNMSLKSKKKQKTSKKKNVQPNPFPEFATEEIDIHEVAGSKKQKKRLEREKILSNTEKKQSPRSLRRLKQMIEEMKPSPPEPKYMNDLIDFTGLDHTCAYCNQSFVSKNKLFKHLNNTGHAIYVTKQDAVSVSKSAKNRKC